MLLQARVKLRWQPLQQQEQLKLALAPQTLLALAPGVELDDEDSLLGGEASECYQAATTVPPPREGGPVAAQQLPADGHDHGLLACHTRIQNPESIVRVAARRATGVSVEFSVMTRHTYSL